MKNLLINEFANLLINLYFCHRKNGPVAQLNRASDSGSEGRGFESPRGHSFFYSVSLITGFLDYRITGLRGDGMMG